MRGRTKWIVTAVVVSSLAGAAVFSTAWSGEALSGMRGPGLFGPGRPLLRCIQGAMAKLKSLRGELNLSPEQKIEVVTILKGYRSDIAKAIRKVHAARKSVMGAVRADKVDQAAIRRAARGLADALGDAAVLRAEVRRDVRAVLDSQQLAKVDAVIAEIEKSVDKTIGDLPK